MTLLFNWLSFLPIIVLLLVSLWKGVKAGVYAGFIVTILLFFSRGSELVTFLASIFSALIGTINILMIIFGAVFLYHIMEQKKYIVQIKTSLAEIHPDKTFRFYFLALFFTAFFESVAGFGTPGAIVPLLLISLGFSPVLSIAVVLLIDGFFAISGAVGTPVIAGLQTPLGLETETVRQIYLISTLLILAGGIAVMLFIRKFVKEEHPSFRNRYSWILYFAIMIPFVGVSYFAMELTGIIAAITMALFAYLFLFKHKRILWKPWMPYLVLVSILLLPKIFPWLAEILAYDITFSSIYGTGVTASLQPFKSPLIPFLLAAVFALYQVRDFRVDLKPVFSKTFTVFLILFPSLAITQLMLNSGTEYPSMINALANIFVQTGPAYPVFSPLIGVLGAFITGSTTVSNIIFSSIQYTSAQNLNISPPLILSLQLAGASLGNAVCLFNIIAAAAIVGISDYSKILKVNLLPVILASLICAAVAYCFIYLI
ncbi:MAG: L-lactate permease [Candidatus Cyclobacteriaceae bacterium M3_2C_046]